MTEQDAVIARKLHDRFFAAKYALQKMGITKPTAKEMMAWLKSNPEIAPNEAPKPKPVNQTD